MNPLQADFLHQSRVVFLQGTITNEIAHQIRMQLLQLHHENPIEDIILYIDSPGGEVLPSLSVIDVMNFIKPKITTVCTGEASSMAAVILSAGEKGKRCILKRSRIMIHQVFSEQSGRFSDLKSQMYLTEELQKEILQELSKNTGRSYDSIRKDCVDEKWLNSQEAQCYGLVDRII